MVLPLAFNWNATSDNVNCHTCNDGTRTAFDNIGSRLQEANNACGSARVHMAHGMPLPS
jgi:hypothetical protein